MSVWDAIPGVNIVSNLAEGKYRDAFKNAVSGGTYGTVDELSGGRANDIAGYIPGVNGVNDVINGDYAHAAKNFATGGLYGPAEGVYNGVKNVAGDIKDAYTAPFDEKRKGYDAVIAQTEKLKAERMARKDKTYAMAEEKYRPAREALAAVYGDPSSWKL